MPKDTQPQPFLLRQTHVQQREGSSFAVQWRTPRLHEPVVQIEPCGLWVLLVDIHAERRARRADMVQQGSANALAMLLWVYEEHFHMVVTESNEP